MPLYTYRLADGSTREVFQHIRDDALTEIDGQPCERVPSLARAFTDDGAGTGNRTTRKLFSLAVDSVEEVHEFRRRNPGVEISDDPNHPDFGVPIVHSLQEKRKVLDNEGFVDLDSYT